MDAAIRCAKKMRRKIRKTRRMEGLKYNPGTDGPTGRDEAWEL
jgi:hypothetical protein